jgi:hypothetical protein
MHHVSCVPLRMKQTDHQLLSYPDVQLICGAGGLKLVIGTL